MWLHVLSQDGVAVGVYVVSLATIYDHIATANPRVRDDLGKLRTRVRNATLDFLRLIGGRYLERRGSVRTDEEVRRDVRVEQPKETYLSSCE